MREARDLQKKKLYSSMRSSAIGRDFEICNYRLRGLAYLHIDGIRRAYIFACLLS